MVAFQWNFPFVCSKRFNVRLKRKWYFQLNDSYVLVFSLSIHLSLFYDCPTGVRNTHNLVLFCKHMLNSLQTESNEYLAIDSTTVGNTKHSICTETMISSKQLVNFSVISSIGTYPMAWDYRISLHIDNNYGCFRLERVSIYMFECVPVDGAWPKVNIISSKLAS